MKQFLNKADEPTRRQFMTNAARAYLGVHLFPMLGPSIASAAAEGASKGAKAKHVIYLYMAGGMSHLDTFDPKPANKENMGPVKTIQSVADVELSEYLPNTAKVTDKMCIINSLTSTQGAHEQGNYMMHTSYSPRGTITHPALGSWVMKLGGKLHPELPGFVTINSGAKAGNGGFFGAKYSAAPIGRPTDGLQDSTKPNVVTDESFDRRLALADKLNTQFHSRYQNTDVKAYEELYKDAISLMNSEDLKAFDLGQEDSATRKLYGDGQFAQGCLLARRLVEHKVRFVEVQLGGWDTHVDNFTAVAARCKEFDQAYAALLTDLEKRGLLKDTLVVVATEFGRSPEIKSNHKDGRDHHPSAFSCVLAGGGVNGGQKYGETDKGGNKVVRDKVTVPDFNATIAYALGLPHDLVLMSPSKRPFQIADKGTPVTSIFG
ncbi:MAG: DUF1501 domain-containing protein [Akkermansiaceae bacterium]|nr:DUF1501 domain-containing protein [Akkermansiaceae bacterium]MDP4647407.1 DUF1501 domain-containing protein [Akkermansiaceae bacterium]MDP4781552.1 DUF1501 domain-containing protein [Akkermansiaceae bacterium]MDP4994590.1 DUF1501 domain-containing protein [Akkermansiaceae bacterium]